MSDIEFALNTMYLLFSGALVMWMAAGFTMLEAGLVRSKNVSEIVTKNIGLYSIACVMYLVCGFYIMYPGDSAVSAYIPDFSLKYLGLTMGGQDKSYGSYAEASDFFFQVVFVATAMSIVSGAIAERMKLIPFFLFTIILTGFIYPVQGYWKWGGGFLDQAGYADFAGSGVVHLCGATAALAAVLIVGPRMGKYTSDGKSKAIPGSNIPMASLGGLILWLGWFGFNPGSELAADGYVMSVAVNTLIAAAAGGAVSAIVVVMKTGKPDVGMVGNGVLGGLVGITAGCGAFNTFGSLITGAVAGSLVVFSVLFIEKKGIDDPVGAVSVHGTCGIWGVLSIGLFARYDDAFLGRDDAGLFYGGGLDQLWVQFLMVLIIITWTAITAGIAFKIIKKTTGLRVSPEEEAAGLDISEHGAAGYHLDTTN